MSGISDQIIIIGSGSYVLGDVFGPGPVLRGVVQWARRQSRSRQIDVKLACRSPEKQPLVTAQACRAAEEVDGARHLSVVSLDDAIAAIDQKPLAVFVCVPDMSHEIYIRRAVATNCPVWVVKPVTGERKSADDLIALADKGKAGIWVDYHKRFDPSNAFLRKAIMERRFGPALHYAVQYTQPRELPLGTFGWSKERDVFTYIGCHYVDQLDFLFPGIVIERVSALGLADEVHVALRGRCYDLVVAQLVCRTAEQEPLLATMQVGWNDPKGSPSKSHQRVEITFSRGRVIADQKARGLQLWDYDGTHELNPYFLGSRLDPADQRLVYDGYGIESINRFLDWCIAPAETHQQWRQSISLPWIERSAFTEQVLDMARRSLDAHGAWIEE